MRPLITLTTDFGLGSPYVAQMKGVIYAHCRQAEIVDIAHGIRPQHVREGALVLADVTPRFPPGTIHVAVVDPGVGTGRRLVYAEFGGQRYLAPDNGLLTLVSQNLPRGGVTRWSGPSSGRRRSHRPFTAATSSRRWPVIWPAAWRPKSWDRRCSRCSPW
jgi:S-adenosylmethionine hydrolase